MTNKRVREHSVAQIAFWAAKLFISAILIWYLVRVIDFSEAIARAKTLSAIHLIAAFLLICAQAVLGAIRWKFVLAAIGGYLSISKAVLITYVSLFFSQFLPAALGADLVRVWQSNRGGLQLTTAVTSVMLERFGNLLCIIVMALAVLPFWTRHVQGNGTREVFILVGIAGAMGLVLLMFLDRLPEPWRRWRIVRGVVALALGTRLLFLHPGYACVLLVTAIAGQVALAAAVLTLSIGLGLGVQFIDCLVVMPVVVLVSSLPISVAGWGVREFAMVTAFSTLSVPSDSALALSVVLALIATAVSLPGGVIWLWSRVGGR